MKKQSYVAGKEIHYQHKTKEVPFYHTKYDGDILTLALSEETAQTYLGGTFKTRSDDLFLNAYPKSGTHWLSYITDQIAKKASLQQVEKDFYIGGVPFLDRTPPEEIATLPSPRTMYSHLPYRFAPSHPEQPLKFIVIARNPKDVAVSQFNFLSNMKMFDFNGSWDEFLCLFMEGKGFGGSYFEWVLQWWAHKDDDNVLFLTYEDLKKDLVKQVAIISHFLNQPLSATEHNEVAAACTFEAMKKNKVGAIEKNKEKVMKKDKSFYRKGIIGDWQNYFSPEQVKAFDLWCESNLKETGLSFEFS
jgi:hypothetical protein